MRAHLQQLAVDRNGFITLSLEFKGPTEVVIGDGEARLQLDDAAETGFSLPHGAQLEIGGARPEPRLSVLGVYPANFRVQIPRLHQAMFIEQC